MDQTLHAQRGAATPTWSTSTNDPDAPSAPAISRLWRGREEDPRAVRPLLLGLMAATALLYLWDLGSSGWANSFYSAAVQAGSQSWKAFFFGSSDAANSITVDKTPMSLWVMALSVRLFGLSSWSILIPQALMGVASVGLIHHAVRRATGNAWAGLGAGLVLATTPVAALMFRFNNPDALLVLLMIGAVLATTRAIEDPSRAVRWLALGGALVGFAFLTKMLQAFLVLPALATVYALAASVPIAQRIGHLMIAFATMVAAAGWWIVIVELWPAASRPYIGGSQNNSILELTLGYNGLGRLNGNETGSSASQWGETGIFRMFTSDIGGQIAWLLPAALIFCCAGLWFARRRPRTDLERAGLVVWTVWLAVTTLTFSLMAGIFHAYYTVALAPAIAAALGIGGAILWQHRHDVAARLVVAFALATTGSLAFALLNRTPDFLPALKWIVAAIALVAAAAIVIADFLPRRAVMAVAAGAIIAALSGPAAYAVETAATPHTGSIPSAGPSSGGMGGPGGMGRPGAMGGGGMGGATMGGPPAAAGNGTLGNGAMGNGTAPNGNGTGQPNGNSAGAGGLLNGSESSAEIDALLSEDASYRWVAAAIGSNSASGYQLSTGLPVMAIGGFNGSDPSPTLEQFQQYVADGAIHYFIAGGGMGGPQASGGSSSQISSWVEANFTATTVDGVTLYDLSQGVQ